MRRIIQLAITLAGSIFAIAGVHYCNIVSVFSFVPFEKQYDVGLALYFTLAETGMHMLYTLVMKKWDESKTVIEAMFFSEHENPRLASRPVIRFDKMGIAKVKLRIKIEGNAGNIKGEKLLIYGGKQFDVQLDKKGNGVALTNDGDLCFDFSSFCKGQSKFVKHIEDYSIVMQRRNFETRIEDVVMPEMASEKTRK